MKLQPFILIFAIFISLSSGAQQIQPDIYPTQIESAEVDSLLNSLEELEGLSEDSLQNLDEVLYKNSWNCTQINYPTTALPSKSDTIEITFNIPGVNAYVHPVKGKVISKYGIRRGRMHTGTDIKLVSGDTVRCAFDGKVRLAKRFSGYGNLVLVRHTNGLETIYSHLKSISVKINDTIKAGDVVGLGGRTGRATTDHLHFETRLFGQHFNSEKYIDFENFSLRAEKIYYANRRFEIDKDKLKKKPTTADAQMLASADGSTRHVIRRGDNLWTIARRYNTTVNKLCTANKITAQKTLKIGSVLLIN
jgi:hypothetical protein